MDADGKEQPTILDYWRVVWNAKIWIVLLTIVAAGGGYAFARMQPKIYTARATILTPKDSAPQGLSGSLGALLGGGGRDGGGGGLNIASLTAGPSMSPNLDMFMALLKSRTLRLEVVAEARKTLGPDVGAKIVGVTPDAREKGVIALTVEATDPRVAADIANSYFTALDRMVERYADQSTQRQKVFYGDQLQRAAREVTAAEEALVKFQNQNHIIPLDANTKQAIDTTAGLRGTILGLEMQREVMRMKMTEQHPQMREIDKQIEALKRQYSKNLFGAPMDLPSADAGAGRGTRKEFFVPTEKMTPVQFAYMKLYRNLKIQEAFYTGALQGLEQMKYSDGGPGARVDMLDPALIPGAPSRPNVMSVVQAAAAAGLLVGALGAFALEYLRRLRQEDRRRVPVNGSGNGHGNGHGNGRVSRGPREQTRAPRETPRVGSRESVVTHPD
jgi:uncharacterized protein involved in exopolysaccharide biosynthesis